jgi:hypothetical protein
MSSVSSSLLGTTCQRNSHAQYWTFVSQDAGRFWDFLAHSREVRQPQPLPPRYTETTSATGAPATATHSAVECVRASPKSVP